MKEKRFFLGQYGSGKSKVFPIRGQEKFSSKWGRSMILELEGRRKKVLNDQRCEPHRAGPFVRLQVLDTCRRKFSIFVPSGRRNAKGGRVHYER